MSKQINSLRAEICEIGRRMWRKGFGAGFDGNISARVDKNRVLCTPTGVLKGFLKAAQICLIDMSAKPLGAGGKPTSEINLHLEIYRQRPDVAAVIHAHPPGAVAFCCAGVTLPEGVYPEADAMLGRVPMVEYFTPGDPKLGAAVRKAIGADTNTVLMANHGSVSFGPDLTQAYCRLEVLEAYCRVLLMLLQIGRARPITRKQMRELLELKVSRGMPDERLASLHGLAARSQEFLALLRRGR